MVFLSFRVKKFQFSLRTSINTLILSKSNKVSLKSCKEDFRGTHTHTHTHSAQVQVGDANTYIALEVKSRRLQPAETQ